MKKLSFVLALVFAASWVMAQHISTVNENGNGNSATITQGFMDVGTFQPGNISNVDQTGDFNAATVVQANGGFAGDQHNSTIVQDGTSNTASVNQQRSAGNAFLEQIGGSNTASIIEDGNFGANIPSVTPYSNYDAYLSQVGDDNKADMKIYGTNSAALTLQFGDNNQASQQLGQDVGNKVQNSSAIIRQGFAPNDPGNNNIAKQVMEGEGYAGGIQVLAERERINQYGDNNYAEQNQKDDGIGIGTFTSSYAKAHQNGDWNQSWQTQTGSSNDSEVEQNGDHNWSMSLQTGLSNTFILTQSGNDTSTLSQIGNNNNVTVIQ